MKFLLRRFIFTFFVDRPTVRWLCESSGTEYSRAPFTLHQICYMCLARTRNDFLANRRKNVFRLSFCVFGLHVCVRPVTASWICANERFFGNKLRFYCYSQTRRSEVTRTFSAFNFQQTDVWIQISKHKTRTRVMNCKCLITCCFFDTSIETDIITQCLNRNWTICANICFYFIYITKWFRQSAQPISQRSRWRSATFELTFISFHSHTNFVCKNILNLNSINDKKRNGKGNAKKKRQKYIVIVM